MSLKKYFELIEGTSAKFWEITVEDTKVLTRFGRIGSNGQATEKEEETSEKAMALFLKLIAEKTKKGYIEASNDQPLESGAISPAAIRLLWDDIAAGSPDALQKYLKLFGAKAEDRLVIARILERFHGAQIIDDALVLSLVPLYDGEADESNATDVVFALPYEGAIPEDLPATVLDACKIANGVSFESSGGGFLGFIGIIDDGNFGGAGGWDPGAFDADEIDGLTGAMDFGQNWICFNAHQKNKLGEPQLVFVSHEGGDPTAIANADKLSFGQVTLRVISQYFTEETELDEVYN